MGKENIIKKIKFMEEALEEGEKFDLIGTFDRNGNVKLSLVNKNITEILLMNDEDRIFYCLLDSYQVENKKHEVEMYIDSFCNCNLDDIIIHNKECQCKLPSWEKGEEWWYNKKIEQMKEFLSELNK